MSRTGGAAMIIASLFAAVAADASGGLGEFEHLSMMQPEVVAGLLAKVEHEWEGLARADLGNQTVTGVSLAAMQKSCGKVARAIVAGSEGDKDRVATYLEEVCGRASSDSAPMCQSFASVLDAHLSPDEYDNRESLNLLDGVCTDFYNGAVKQQVVGLVAADKAATDKAKAAAEAKSKADADAAKAKAETDAKTKVEAQRMAKAEKDAYAKEEQDKSKHRILERREASLAHANQLEAKSAQDVSLATNFLSRAKQTFHQAMKQSDAVDEESKTATDIAVRARKAFGLAAEKEAEAAEKESKEAQENVLHLKEEAADAQKEKAEAATRKEAEKEAEAAEKEAKEAQEKVLRLKAEAKAKTASKVVNATKASAKVEKKTALLDKSVAAQDPCAGCTDPAVVEYQKCSSTMKYNPCAKQYTGAAFDNHCCIVKEQHMRCLQCKAQGTRKHYNSKWTDQKNTGVTVVEAQLAKKLGKTNVAVDLDLALDRT